MVQLLETSHCTTTNASSQKHHTCEYNKCLYGWLMRNGNARIQTLCTAVAAACSECTMGVVRAGPTLQWLAVAAVAAAAGSHELLLLHTRMVSSQSHLDSHSSTTAAPLRYNANSSELMSHLERLISLASEFWSQLVSFFNCRSLTVHRPQLATKC